MKLLKVNKIFVASVFAIGVMLPSFVITTPVSATHCQASNVPSSQGLKYATWGCGSAGVQAFSNFVVVGVSVDDRISDGYCVYARADFTNRAGTTYIDHSCGSPQSDSISHPSGSQGIYVVNNVRIWRNTNYLTLWWPPAV